MLFGQFYHVLVVTDMIWRGSGGLAGGLITKIVF
jgi:hypothetical protein